MPYFHRDGVSLFYINEGQGPPVLFLHGLACDSQDFIFQIPFLQALGYQTIAFDARGHGRSSVPPESRPEQLRPEVTSDDAVALLIHLDITAPVFVLGHSLGCLTASLLAVRSPWKVRALVLVDPIYFQTAEAHEKFTMALTGHGRAHEVLGRVFALPEEKPAWLRTWHRMRLLATPEWVLYQVAYQKQVVQPAVGTWEVAREVLVKRACPRLVVLKDEVNLENEKTLGLVRRDRITVLDGGHWLHVQEAVAFNQIMGDWLDNL